MATIKTRFAPSPTGYIHFGNVRTALFNVLFARRQQGRFLLRIEDTDAERSREEYTDGLKRDLSWLGLDWDEGEARGGEHAPYRQSERTAVYEAHMEKLAAAGHVYPCFCTAQELEISRKIQVSSGRPPRYSGKCAHMSRDEAAAKKAQGLPFVLRFRMPKGETIAFDDLVRGAQKYPTDDIGDFIIRRSDGSYAFFFTNAIDDALMRVTHVLRGEDHLTNTPRQIAILQALGLPVATYGHISLIVAANGNPLSKRLGSMSVVELREKGYFPLAVNNYLARLGHHYADTGLLGMDELSARFDAANLGKSPARYDKAQLDYWQGAYVQQAPLDEIAAWLAPHVAGLVPEEQLPDFAQAVRGNILFPDEAALWAAALFGDAPARSDAALEAIRAAGAAFFAQAADCLAPGGDYKTFTAAVKAATGATGKALFLPLRAALTGQASGPEMPELFRLMGEARAAARLRAAAAV